MYYTFKLGLQILKWIRIDEDYGTVSAIIS